MQLLYQCCIDKFLIPGCNPQAASEPASHVCNPISHKCSCMRGFTPALGEPGGQTRCRQLRPGELDTMETNIHGYNQRNNNSYVAAR